MRTPAKAIHFACFARIACLLACVLLCGRAAVAGPVTYKFLFEYYDVIDAGGSPIGYVDFTPGIGFSNIDIPLFIPATLPPVDDPLFEMGDTGPVVTQDPTGAYFDDSFFGVLFGTPLEDDTSLGSMSFATNASYYLADATQISVTVVNEGVAPVATPEPGSWLLTASGALLIAVAAWWKRLRPSWAVVAG